MSARRNNANEGALCAHRERHQQPAAARSLAERVEAFLVAAMRDIERKNEAFVQEHLFRFDLRNRVLFQALARVTVVPVKSCDSTEVDHACILSEYTRGTSDPKKKGAACAAPFGISVGGSAGLEVHAAHAAAARACGIGGFLLRMLGDHRLGGDQQAGDRSRVLQRRAHDLGRVDDAGRDEVLVLLVLGVEAEGVGLRSPGPCRPRSSLRRRRSRRSGGSATRARGARC